MVLYIGVPGWLTQKGGGEEREGERGALFSYLMYIHVYASIHPMSSVPYCALVAIGSHASPPPPPQHTPHTLDQYTPYIMCIHIQATQVVVYSLTFPTMRPLTPIPFSMVTCREFSETPHQSHSLPYTIFTHIDNDGESSIVHGLRAIRPEVRTLREIHDTWTKAVQ